MCARACVYARVCVCVCVCVCVVFCFNRNVENNSHGVISDFSVLRPLELTAHYEISLNSFIHFS